MSIVRNKQYVIVVAPRRQRLVVTPTSPGAASKLAKTDIIEIMIAVVPVDTTNAMLSVARSVPAQSQGGHHKLGPSRRHRLGKDRGSARIRST